MKKKKETFKINMFCHLLINLKKPQSVPFHYNATWLALNRFQKPQRKKKS